MGKTTYLNWWVYRISEQQPAFGQFKGGCNWMQGCNVQTPWGWHSITLLKLRFSHLKMHGWKTFSFPFGVWPSGRCELLVSGSVYTVWFIGTFNNGFVKNNPYISLGTISTSLIKTKGPRVQRSSICLHVTQAGKKESLHLLKNNPLKTWDMGSIWSPILK